MNIKRAKEEIEHTVKAYLAKDALGEYAIPAIRQRPILLMGPPGIGKTQVMEQVARECGVALVAYTITHHTRQSAVGLPFIRERNYGGRTRSVTEYTMSEIIASVYAAMERTGKKNGILFIGPSAKVLGQMGDKLSAKEIALACGVPIIPGCTEPLRDAEDAVEKAVSFGFPVILKAAAGGGGRGMRRCDSPEEVRTAYELVHSEAEKAFGCGDIFMEKYLVEPKHIEVQILADQHGNVYHLGERDCSLQRRYQKVVEFAPAWSVPQETVEALRRDAVKIARSVGYVSAGTVEFLVDKNGGYYFIEMNTRIQVESIP